MTTFMTYKEECEALRQRVQELEERRCEVCGYAEHHREHTGCLRVKVKELTAERDKATQYWQIAEGRCDALKQQRDELLAALENTHNALKCFWPEGHVDAVSAIASVKEKS